MSRALETPSLECRDLSDADILERILAVAHRNMDRLGYPPVNRSLYPPVEQFKESA